MLRWPLIPLLALAAGCSAGTGPPPAAGTPPPPAAATAAAPGWTAAKVVADAPLRPERRVTVAAGEGLAAIARREAVPLPVLARTNGLAPNAMLSAGMQLKIPAGRYHSVRRGETLSAIGRAYRANWRSVAAANALAAPYPLEVGDVIFIPAAQPAGRGTVEERAARNRLDIDGLVKGQPAAQASASPPRPAASSPATPPPAPAIRFDWPVEGRIVSGFGRKPGGRVNDGINIAVTPGATVRAAAEGEVIYAGTGVAAFGALVLMRHQGGWITAYGHNESLLVAKGDKVARNQPIARAGQSGEVDSPQLHFEIRRGRTPVDPALLLPVRPAS